MLGKLAKWLRLLGFDTQIAAFDERGHIDSFLSEAFIPITRTEKWRNIDGLVFIRSNDSFEQLKELISEVGLGPEDIRPFTRCSLCNAELLRIPRDAACSSVPDFVFETATDFRQCPQCQKIYWPGSHKTRMLEKLRSVLGGIGQDLQD